jgi:hypothetical protein
MGKFRGLVTTSEENGDPTELEDQILVVVSTITFASPRSWKVLLPFAAPPSLPDRRRP